jgi:UDP-galactopyranose mutase
LLAGTYTRYQRPIFVAETSYDRAGKGRWICEIAAEVARARESGVPVEGICLYPIIDRPDWDVPQQWHHSGLWDLVPDRSGRLQRVLVEDYAAGLAEARSLVEVGGAE